MHRPTGRVVFGLWFGLFLPPITVGALILAFGRDWAVGALTSIVLLLWVVETARTTCCRCWAYGTAGCGLPSLVAPFLGARKSAQSLTVFRIRLHYFIDLAAALFLNVWYLWLSPLLFPGVVLWTVGAWWVVGRPKRYHGLLHRLRRPRHADRPGRIGLPVIVLGEAVDGLHCATDTHLR
jgi:hypothetical protein